MYFSNFMLIRYYTCYKPVIYVRKHIRFQTLYQSYKSFNNTKKIYHPFPQTFKTASTLVTFKPVELLIY